MEISEVRVKLVSDSSDRLKAYCSITIDGCFVVRDLKIIDGTNGLFVAMPSRKLAARCPCGSKNHLRARHCNECGQALEGDRLASARTGRNKLHADIAHPINAECREFIQNRVIEEYEAETNRAQDPEYRGSRYDDEDYDDGDVPATGFRPYEELIDGLNKNGDASSESTATEAEPSESTEPEPRPPSPRPGQVPTPVASQVREADDKPPDRAPDPVADTTGDDDFGSGIL
ncbi:MAG: stage V sporulation protein G [bacterium]|nr:stage V sporulation protein G [bacterium]